MACATLKRSLEWDPIQSSPANPSTRPSKRRCYTSPYRHAVPPKEASPFGEVTPKVSSADISANIKQEMRRLHNRKQLHFVSNDLSDGSAIQGSESTSNDSQQGTASNMGLLSPSRRDQPLFTFKQVSLICERLLKEREEQVREEYDSILTNKMADQYDTFVKFTYDQIQKRFESGPTPSYLS